MRRPRILLARPGADGPDVGVRAIVGALREAGMEVVDSGPVRTPDAIAACAAERGVDLIGLGICSAADVPLVRKVLTALRAAGCDVPVVLGGPVPDADVPDLERLGVAAVFPSPTTSLEAVVACLRGIAPAA